MASINVTVKGLKEVERKLDTSFLLTPNINAVRDSVVKRIQRQGKGMGGKAITLAADVYDRGARITTTLNKPRQTGSSWQRYNQQHAGAVARNSANKQVREIEKQWAS